MTFFVLIIVLYGVNTLVFTFLCMNTMCIYTYHYHTEQVAQVQANFCCIG